MKELQIPRSDASWAQVAQRHSEFFRVAPDGENQISLVARHVTPRAGNKREPLASDYTSKLLQLAVELHDREVRRSERWHVWMPVIVALTAGAVVTLPLPIRCKGIEFSREGTANSLAEVAAFGDQFVGDHSVGQSSCSTGDTLSRRAPGPIRASPNENSCQTILQTVCKRAVALGTA